VIAVVLALGALLIGAVVLVVMRSSALTAARARIGELDAEVASVRADLAATTVRATTAEANAAEEKARADAQAKRTAEATKEAKAAAAKAAAEAARATTAESTAREATARAEADEALLRVLPPDGLWALEAQRIARLWRERVSVTLDGVSPVVDAKDPALEAVQVLASASREESGVVVDLSWSVDPVADAPHAVALVRLAEELIATARLADGAELDVRIEGDELVLRLSTDSAIGSPADLIDALARCGWKTEVLGRTIVVHLPAT
jgi:hypothetical protein